MASPQFSRRRVGLQLKLVSLLLLAVLAPLGASAYLIDQIGKVAGNVAAYEAEQRQGPMEKALGAYRDVVEVTKRLHAEVATRLASTPGLDGADPGPVLDELLAHEPGLHELALLAPSGDEVTRRSRPLPSAAWRLKSLEQPRAGGGALRLGFAVPASLQDDYLALKASNDQAKTLAANRSALPSSYKRAFLALVGAAALIAIVIGVVAARRVTRRVTTLVDTARAVGAGDPSARVRLAGTDEMAELGAALDGMLDQIDASRRQVEYLQRIGAWQDVARRLAHEIKNPLTPIQLAVQQCVSSYPGPGGEPNPKFQRLLADTGEIVEEEIAGLRRLVDTFRTLGQLPKVEPIALPLAEVIEELRLDPVFAARLTLAPSKAAITVHADKLLLKRVLANLVENGVHAGQEAGRAGDVVIGWGQAAGGRDDHRRRSGRGRAPR
jgi:two-component system nitrogen regulation sensor histidine kinase NtrY